MKRHVVVVGDFSLPSYQRIAIVIEESNKWLKSAFAMKFLRQNGNNDFAALVYNLHKN